MRTTRRVIIVAAGAISLSVAVAAGAAPFSWADTVTPAWPAAQGMTTGVRLPGAGDASAIGVAGQPGSWGRAIEVPGLGALNKGGTADLSAAVSSVSCASAGNCAAGGYYTNRHHHTQGFVAVERHGRWGKAIKVPGLGALNKGDAGWDASVTEVSCASAGNCAAGGFYTDQAGNTEGFVASERHGRWRKAIEVRGLAALGYENADVESVSCASAGNCAAVGYGDPYGDGFAVSEKNGRWGKAIDVAGGGRFAGLNSVSCASPGNCAAGGFYSNDSG